MIVSPVVSETRTVEASVVVSEVADIVPEVLLPGIWVPFSRSSTLAGPVEEVFVPITEYEIR